MELIDVKTIDKKLLLKVNESLSNREFLDYLKEKLSALLFVNTSERKEIILDILSRNLTSKEMLEMFDIFETDNRYLVSKIQCSKKVKEEISIIKGSIRAGEVKVFNKSVLLIGTINKGSKDFLGRGKDFCCGDNLKNAIDKTVSYMYNIDTTK